MENHTKAFWKRAATLSLASIFLSLATLFIVPGLLTVLYALVMYLADGYWIGEPELFFVLGVASIIGIICAVFVLLVGIAHMFEDLPSERRRRQ